MLLGPWYVSPHSSKLNAKITKYLQQKSKLATEKTIKITNKRINHRLQTTIKS